MVELVDVNIRYKAPPIFDVLFSKVEKGPRRGRYAFFDLALKTIELGS